MYEAWKTILDQLYKSEKFDPDFYQRRYPDVSLSGIPALEHYAKYGILFGRQTAESSPDGATGPAYVEQESVQSSDDVKLTIICTTYNHAKFISETLDGFAMQDVNFKFEVLISDDCSTDETSEIIARYATTYPFIKHIRRPANIGSVPNLLDLARRVSTRYVAICEGDDYWTDPNKLQIQFDFLESHPAYSICFHPVKIRYEDDPERTSFFPDLPVLEYTVDRLARANFIQTNSVMYRWRFCGDLPQEFAQIHPADWYLHLLHAEAGRIGFIDKPMAVYRKHSAGMWADAETNAIELHKRYGPGEIRMFEAVKSHFGGIYDSYLNDMQRHIFSEIFNHFMMQGELASLLDFISAAHPLEKKLMMLCGVDTRDDSLNRDVIEQRLRDELKISVIVTSYNHEKHLRKCLDSILMQKGCFEFEIIIGDDCSTDASQIIIDEYIDRFPAVIRQVREQRNLRMLGNMKRCFAAAKFPFIAICEGDDYWISEYKLSKQLAYLCLNKDCSMVFNWVLLNEERGGRFVPHYAQSLIKADKLKFSDIAQSPLTANFSACMYRASTIESVPQSYYESRDAADWLFNLYAAQSGLVGFIPDLLSVYRVHNGGQWSGMSSGQQMRRVKAVRQELFEIFGAGLGFNDELVTFSVSDLQQTPSIDGSFWMETPVDEEKINVTGRIIEIRGWAIGKGGAPVDIVIEKDRILSSYRTDIQRPDVTAFLLKTSGLQVIDARCGFSIPFPYEVNTTLKVGTRVDGIPKWWKEIACLSDPLQEELPLI